MDSDLSLGIGRPCPYSDGWQSSPRVFAPSQRGDEIQGRAGHGPISLISLREDRAWRDRVGDEYEIIGTSTWLSETVLAAGDGYLCYPAAVDAVEPADPGHHGTDHRRGHHGQGGGRDRGGRAGHRRRGAAAGALFLPARFLGGQGVAERGLRHAQHPVRKNPPAVLWLPRPGPDRSVADAGDQRRGPGADVRRAGVHYVPHGPDHDRRQLDPALFPGLAVGPDHGRADAPDDGHLCLLCHPVAPAVHQGAGAPVPSQHGLAGEPGRGAGRSKPLPGSPTSGSSSRRPTGI